MAAEGQKKKEDKEWQSARALCVYACTHPRQGEKTASKSICLDIRLKVYTIVQYITLVNCRLTCMSSIRTLSPITE